MNRPVLSGTRTPVLSGTANPSYQEPKPPVTLEAHLENRAPNFSNKESFGFLLTPGIHRGLSGAAARKGLAGLRGDTMAVML